MADKLSNKMTTRGDKLTRTQQGFINFIRANPDLLTATVTHMTQVAGIERQTFYKWGKEPEFVAALDATTQEILGLYKSKLVMRSLEEAMGDSFQDRKMLLELTGIVKPEGTTLNQQINIELPDWAKDD